MKVAILTLPLHTNYGGILQVYALQTALQRLGHDVCIVNLPVRREHRKLVWKTYLKRLAANCLFRRKPLRAWPDSAERAVMCRHTGRFVSRYLSVVPCRSVAELPGITGSEKIEAYVVGSDQVWRPGYSPDIPAYFLDFVQESAIRKVAYAASFGVDRWEFTPQLTARCAALAQRFHALSVREDSAVELCRRYLGAEALHVIDPTLLLEREAYEALLPPAAAGPGNGRAQLMAYVLDKNAAKAAWIRRIAESKRLEVNSVGAEARFWDVGKKGVERCVAPPVETWLAGFKQAAYVVTDSFHGTVFSILFRKPFVCIVNRSRGATRFTSLLTALGLSDRMVEAEAWEGHCPLLDKPIDYDAMEARLKQERNKAFAFLEEALAAE